jgi:mannosyltransferase
VTRARTPATERVWLLVVCAAAALVYGNGLGRLPLWRDEVASVDIAARSVPRILAALGRIDVVHGLYYLLLHAVLQVDGSEVAVRMPSLAGAVAAVGLAAELARRVLGVVAATVAAAVMIANPLLSFYAREARPYALGVMLVCASNRCMYVVSTENTTNSGHRHRHVVPSNTNAAAHTSITPSAYGRASRA